MWPFNKKPKKHTCKVEYVPIASLDSGKAVFQFKDMQVIYVEAEDLWEAQQEVASKLVLTPHIYIHRISKVH